MSRAEKQRDNNTTATRDHDAGHLAPYRFKPGQSGNPGGRPKGSVSLTTELRKLLEANDHELAKELVQATIEHARRGKSAPLTEIWNRVDGAVPVRVQVEQARMELLAVVHLVCDQHDAPHVLADICDELERLGESRVDPATSAQLAESSSSSSG